MYNQQETFIVFVALILIVALAVILLAYESEMGQPISSFSI